MVEPERSERVAGHASAFLTIFDEAAGSEGPAVLIQAMRRSQDRRSQDGWTLRCSSECAYTRKSYKRKLPDMIAQLLFSLMLLQQNPVEDFNFLLEVQSSNMPGLQQTVEGRGLFMIAARCYEGGMSFEEKHVRALAQYVQMMEETYFIPQAVLTNISRQAAGLGEEAAADSTGADCARYFGSLTAVIPGIDSLYD